MTQGTAGVLKYQDVSTGRAIAQHPSHLGAPGCLAQNPYNAVMLMGHTNGRHRSPPGGFSDYHCAAQCAGTVTMWTPNMSEPVVKMLTHGAPVQAIAVDSVGRFVTVLPRAQPSTRCGRVGERRHMATAGLDSVVSIWDLRTYRKMHSSVPCTLASTVQPLTSLQQCLTDLEVMAAAGTTHRTPPLSLRSPNAASLP